MGWFWVDSTPPQTTRSRSPPKTSADPPRECPMHKQTQSSSSRTTSESSSPCPYKPATTASPARSSSPSYVSGLNPLNYMPAQLSNTRDATQQTIRLPLERESSTIPRGDGSGMWEYPSPQQMYNAMLRKGYDDTPAEHVESMVAVHNFLNEGAWQQIKEWEGIFSSGLWQGWRTCAQGGENLHSQRWAMERARRGLQGRPEPPEPRLTRFMGRPHDLTPKARLQAWMAWMFPSDYDSTLPFDRHDWFVQRQLPNGHTKEVRYVIDYYSGPTSPEAEPVFFLDVRPAVDGPTSASERIIRWSGDIWYRASGAQVRHETRAQKRLSSA